MSEPVLDTMVLQALGFGHPQGLTILLSSLVTARFLIPAEVYNQDEEALPLTQADRGISELGRGLRFASRKALAGPAAQAARYQRWLLNAKQISDHITQGTLVITQLDLGEIQQRERLMREFGIGRGEAACLVVAQREAHPALFVSSDEIACRVAKEISVPYATLIDVVESCLDPYLTPLHRAVRGDR